MPLPNIKPKLWERERLKSLGLTVRINPEIEHSDKEASYVDKTEWDHTISRKPDPEVIRLMEFFELYQPGPDPFMLNNHTRINDQKHFIQDALRRIQFHEPGGRVYESEVYRLKQYFELIKN